MVKAVFIFFVGWVEERNPTMDYLRCWVSFLNPTYTLKGMLPFRRKVHLQYSVFIRILIDQGNTLDDAMKQDQHVLFADSFEPEGVCLWRCTTSNPKAPINRLPPENMIFPAKATG